METWNKNSFNLKKFKNEDIVIHCDTEEKANDLLNYLDNLGITWVSGSSLLNYNNWEEYKQNTCYEFYNKGISYADCEFYKDENCKIIEWEIVDKKTRGFEIVSDEFKKTNEEITLPTRGSKISAGYDFYSPIDIVIQPHSKVCVWSDIKAYMQEGEVLLLYVRSSIGIKRGLRLSNGTGVIDADYYSNSDNDGNIGISLHNYTDEPVTISKGERICQGIFIPFLVADNGNTDKERVGGIGSTGTK